ncbi:MAG: XRE family transcriptional regulator [Eubacteriales bacterium]
MGRVSTKEHKNKYQVHREELKLSREKASELMQTITPERIEKIENEKAMPYPDEILEMAQGYKAPGLCNHYCSKQCPIGKQYVPEIKIKDLSQIVLEMVSSLNSMHKQKDTLIEIAADGVIDADEIEDFVRIQEALERISITVETLQLWTERMIANQHIDINIYNKVSPFVKTKKSHFLMNQIIPIFSKKQGQVPHRRRRAVVKWESPEKSFSLHEHGGLFHFSTAALGREAAPEHLRGLAVI